MVGGLFFKTKILLKESKHSTLNIHEFSSLVLFFILESYHIRFFNNFYNKFYNKHHCWKRIKPLWPLFTKKKSSWLFQAFQDLNMQEMACGFITSRIDSCSRIKCKPKTGCIVSILHSPMWVFIFQSVWISHQT